MKVEVGKKIQYLANKIPHKKPHLAKKRGSGRGWGGAVFLVPWPGLGWVGLGGGEGTLVCARKGSI